MALAPTLRLAWVMTLSRLVRSKTAVLSWGFATVWSARLLAAGGGDSTVPGPTNAPADDRLVTFEGSRAVVGPSHVPLMGAAFYVAVDRQDLADRYLLREDRKKEVATFGYVALAAGIGWGALDLLVTFAKNTQCCDGPGPARVATVSPFPWALAGAGLATALIAKNVPTDPISLTERSDLARAHNARLKLLPQLQPGGAGLSAAGAF
jgi:hypothetical protein